MSTTVGNGVVSSGLMISSGQSISVQSGGEITNTQINDGGYVVVGSGGTALNTNLTSSTAELVLSSGATAVGITLTAGADATLFGNVDGLTVVGSGPYQRGAYVASGTTTDVTVSSGGWVYVDEGGVISGVTVLSGGNTDVDNDGITNVGGTALNVTIASGGTQHLLGRAAVGSGVTVEAGGSYILGDSWVSDVGITTTEVGGTNYAASVESGGYYVISSGGTGINDTGVSGGVVLVSSGGTEIGISGTQSGITIDGGDYVVSVGASAVGATLNAGMMTNNGGTVSDLAINGGTAWMDGGIGTDITVSGSAAQFNLVSGYVSGLTVENNGDSTISGTVSDATINNGVAYIAGGTVSGATITNGGGMSLQFGSATDIIVGSGGTDQTYNDGVAGGAQVTSVTVESGGVQQLFQVKAADSAIAQDVTVQSGGSFIVGGVIVGSEIFQGGTNYDATVSSGGVYIISDGGTGINDSGVSGGVVRVASGGTEIGISGTQAGIVVESGGSYLLGGIQVAAGGSVTEYSAVVSGGGVYNIYSGGTGYNDTGVSGGYVFVGSGGTEIGTFGTQTGVLAEGGTYVVSQGATAVGAAVNSGTIIDNGGVTTYATIGSGGTEIVSSGGVVSGAVLAGGTLSLGDQASITGGVGYTSQGGTLLVGNAGDSLQNVLLTGFTSANDALDLGFAQYASGDHYQVNGSQLTIFNGAGAVIETVNIEGATASGYDLEAAANGTLELVVCYYPGTLIRTAKGEVNVESLSIGDVVITTDGDAKPIRWIGRNTVSTRFADLNRVLPIRISKGALGVDLPVRDLLVSPDHAILVDGILINAGALVNGETITREHNVPELFTYYHIEVEGHSLVWAEGIPAETFVDNVSRMAFDNWSEYLELGLGEGTIMEMDYPRARSMRQIPEAIKLKLFPQDMRAVKVA